MEKGLPILPGVGVLTYGGVYWEGDHEFNLSNWLDRNPHLVGELPRVDHPATIAGRSSAIALKTRKCCRLVRMPGLLRIWLSCCRLSSRSC
jgi:hypothetical protein